MRQLESRVIHTSGTTSRWMPVLTESEHLTRAREILDATKVEKISVLRKDKSIVEWRYAPVVEYEFQTRHLQEDGTYGVWRTVTLDHATKNMKDIYAILSTGSMTKVTIHGVDMKIQYRLKEVSNVG